MVINWTCVEFRPAKIEPSKIDLLTIAQERPNKKQPDKKRNQ